MASSYVDIRRFPRATVEAGFGIRFQAGGRRFFGLPVTNLGGGGCCFRVSRLLATVLQQGMTLTQVYLEHPAIPQLPQRARVTWVMGNHPGHDEPTVLVGLEYLDPGLEFLQAVDRQVAMLLKQQVPSGAPGR